MPEDDVDVIYFFKRGFANVRPRAITVVESTTGVRAALERHPVGLRYRALFGDEIDWHPERFEKWMNKAAPSGFALASRRRPVGGDTRARRPARVRSVARSA
jgi:hypothetical protein